jgi:hypothetical protein
MEHAERLARLLNRVGLRSEVLGPIEEWSPVDAATYQTRHDKFWQTVTQLLPDDEDDEAFWMTEAAADQLEHNN